MLDSLVVNTVFNAVKEIAIDESFLNSKDFPWMWIAFFEAIVIVILALIVAQKKKPISDKEKFVQEAKDGTVDFDNLINSGFNAKALYDELKVHCHPDRFPEDTERNRIALTLFQDISQNKTNYNKLLELKHEATLKLDINF